MQQIPSKNHEIRLMFEASTEYGEAVSEDDSFAIRKLDDVQAYDGSWIRAKDLKAGDVLSCEGKPSVVTQVLDDGDTLRVTTEESEVM